MKNKILGLDFDGTCVTHDYPKVGRDIGASVVLKKFIKNGWKICLNTMRSGDTLQEAVDWFEDTGIELYGINKNPDQHTWTKSTKVYAHLYIDDAALGCPLITPVLGRPYVDWKTVSKLVFGEN